MVLLAACGGDTVSLVSTPTAADSPFPAEGISTTFSPQLVETVVHLYEMEGHLITSRELWGRQHLQEAAAHAAHPHAELFFLVQGPLAEKKAGSDQHLLDALQRLVYLVANGADDDEVQAAYEAAFAAIEEAATVLAGETLQDPTFVTLVIISLLERANQEYTEAIESTTVVNLEEYQDAYGYLISARQLFQRVADEARARDIEEYFKVADTFEQLGSLLPATASPPTPPADPALVSADIKTIQVELAEIFGVGRNEMTVEETLAFISRTLEQAIVTYEAGNVEEAYELAASAYLDGFEPLERQLSAQDYTSLVETLEVQFKQFRTRIRAGVPVEELRALQQKIEANLEQVATALKNSHIPSKTTTSNFKEEHT
ncbi:MAG: hypothetical protein Q9O62_02775 [Ardenticatenia bacterium]|nr:hypothetical protein [Ardenticatenia bacterium]